VRSIEKEHSILIDTPNGDEALIGFTKPTISGDPSEDAPKALSLTAGAFGTSFMKQVHGADIKLVDRPGQYTCDGIFTAAEKLALFVKTADCLPLLFYSKEKGVTGAVHMGWRSAKDGILENIPFGLSSFEVIAGVGMRDCCYQVGSEFLDHGRFNGFVGMREGVYYFDPVGFARTELIKKGLSEKMFFDYNICSHCSADGYFSHRKNATNNRTLSFVMKLGGMGPGSGKKENEDEKDPRSSSCSFLGLIYFWPCG
jgi:copper oxidase (laccase) domain-containing protein